MYICCIYEKAAVAEWLSSWLVEQEDRGSIGYLLLPSRDMAEIPRWSDVNPQYNQSTNQPTNN